MKKLKAKLNGQGGFTLVEMLIVVAIIAILVAVSIPMVSASLTKAEKATDAANVRAAIMAATVASLEKDYLGGTVDLSNPVPYDAQKGDLDPSGDVPSSYGQNESGVIWVKYDDGIKWTWASTAPSGTSVTWNEGAPKVG